MNEYDPIVSEFESAEDEEAYDRWFRAKVEKALADPRPPVPHNRAMQRLRHFMEQRFGKPC